MIETQFRNFRIYFRHIFFDEVRGQILEALLAIREGYARCPAHQWMRIEKLVSMPLLSAQDLNPQINIFNKNIPDLGPKANLDPGFLDPGWSRIPVSRIPRSKNWS